MILTSPNTNKSILRKQDLFPEAWNCIGLCAPASRAAMDRYQAAVRFLEQLGFRCLSFYPENPADELSYLSASAEDRAGQLNRLIRTPEVQAIFCLRGGYGSIHLADQIDWVTLRERNLPVIGYSDITALHAMMLKQHAGIPVSATMALGLEKESANRSFRTHFHRAMMQTIYPGRGPFRKIAHLNLLNHYTDSVRASLVCGNLTVLDSLCGTVYQPRFRNKIVLLEDVGEPVRKIDRALTQLSMSGAFRGCSGIIFGNYLNCGELAEQEILFQRFAQTMKCPVFSGLHFGHCRHSLSFVCGEKAKLQNGGLYLHYPLNADTF